MDVNSSVIFDIVVSTDLTRGGEVAGNRVKISPLIHIPIDVNKADSVPGPRANLPESGEFTGAATRVSHGEEVRESSDETKISSAETPISSNTITISSAETPISGEEIAVTGEEIAVTGEETPISGEETVISSEETAISSCRFAIYI